jgi:hypothetical protein
MIHNFLRLRNYWREIETIFSERHNLMGLADLSFWGQPKLIAVAAITDILQGLVK